MAGSVRRIARRRPIPMLRDALIKVRTESGVPKAIVGFVRRTARRSPNKKKLKRNIPMLRDALIKASTESGVLGTTFGTVRRIARILNKMQQVMLRDARTREGTVF